MDMIFSALETRDYESWLQTREGSQYIDATVSLLDRLLDFQPGWRVLDVGCGLGVHLAHLKEQHGIMVHGLEAGPVMARLASQRLGSQAEVACGDAYDLPYEDNDFDAVIMVNTLEFLERRGQALAEAVRVASSRVLLISFNPWSGGYHLWRYLGQTTPLKQGKPLGFWSLKSLIREFLGLVPQAWGASSIWPRAGLGVRPVSSLLGVCAAVTPRFRTRPLTVKTRASSPPTPAHAGGAASANSSGRIISLHKHSR